MNPTCTSEIVFITANPLQIMISVSIMQQENFHQDCVLIVHGGFNRAEEVARNLILNTTPCRGAKIIYVEHRQAAFNLVKKIKPAQLYVDGDVGFKNFLILGLLKLRIRYLQIFVFEEGLGTYRNDLYKGWKMFLFPMLGIGTNFGGSIWTSGIYVVDPKRYSRAISSETVNVKRIGKGPAETLVEYWEDWIKIFDYKWSDKKNCEECILYLTNWNFDSGILKVIRVPGADHYIKPHPRCSTVFNTAEFRLMDTSAPAEMVISDLSKKYNIVRVFHHGSSVAEYFSRSNVLFVKI